MASILRGVFELFMGGKAAPAKKESSRGYTYDVTSKTLTIFDTSMKEIEVEIVLGAYSKLKTHSIKHLKINCVELTSLIAVQQFDTLESLDLSGCKKLKSLKGIEKCQLLNNVRLAENYLIDDFSPLNKLPQLKKGHLSIRDMQNFGDKEARSLHVREASFVRIGLESPTMAVKEAAGRGSTFRIRTESIDHLEKKTPFVQEVE